jgi:quinoprotein glucose dehydrogenase
VDPPGRGRRGGDAAAPPVAVFDRGWTPAPPRVRQSKTTVLVVGDVMYLATPYNRVLALDAYTGKKIWEFEAQYSASPRGISYWPGDGQYPPTVVFGASGGRLVSLNAKTGKLIPGFGNEGWSTCGRALRTIFLMGGTACRRHPIYKNLVITGAQLQEEPAKGPAGDVRAWDLRTGKLVWTFHTVPRPGEANHAVWQGDEWVDSPEPTSGAS